jgi:restriction system protein
VVERAFWGIHAIKSARIDEVFLERNQLAIGWHELGDLTRIIMNRDALKAALASTYPAGKLGSHPVNAGPDHALRIRDGDWRQRGVATEGHGGHPPR